VSGGILQYCQEYWWCDKICRINYKITETDDVVYVSNKMLGMYMCVSTVLEYEISTLNINLLTPEFDI
jgi:hypothetical protein